MRIPIILASALLALSCSATCRRSPCCDPRPAAPPPTARSAPATPVTPAAPDASAAPVAGIPDRLIGLDKHAITDVPTPTPFRYGDDMPTAGMTLARAWYGMPPQIPHGIEDLLPITAEENACLACHDPTDEDRDPDDGKAIPPSHFTDYRRLPSALGTRLAGARYNCTACHTPCSDAKPLVGNTHRK